MTWHGILGQDLVFERFQRSLELGRLASTYLFVGPPGVGKRSTAVAIAKALLCESESEANLVACGHCSACVQVDAGTHPDLEVVEKPADRTEIPIRLFIGPPENRLREGLCYNLSLKPFRGGRKIAIIDDADYLNNEGANCLLKTLEEPPPRSLLILIGTSSQRQLPTIRSRCQIVRFQPLSESVLKERIQQLGYASTESEAEQLALIADGSLRKAQDMSDPLLREFRERLFGELVRGDFWSTEFQKELSTFVEAAGTDAPSRRNRLRLVIGFALRFYEQLIRKICHLSPSGDQSLVNAVTEASKAWSAGVENAARCVDRCIDALAQIDASAHVTTVTDVWLDEVTALAR